MNHIKYILGIIVFSCSCCALAQQDEELVIDITGALAVRPAGTQQNMNGAPEWIYMEATNTAIDLNASEAKPQYISPRELLNKISIGTWKWENGAALRLSGDRLRMYYGEKTRFNLTVRPFKDEDTIRLTINRNF